MPLSNMKARKLAQLQENTLLKLTMEDGTMIQGKILENDGTSLWIKGQTVRGDGTLSEWVETGLDYEDLRTQGDSI